MTSPLQPPGGFGPAGVGPGGLGAPGSGPAGSGAAGSGPGSPGAGEPGDPGAGSPDGPPPGRARLLIVDDHAMVRQGLRSMLEREPTVQVVAEADSPGAALQAVRDASPDIVLLDLRLGGDSEEDGLALCALITRQFPGVGVLVVTTFLTDRLVTEAIRNGAKGYVLKDVDAVQLLQSIHAVRRGESAFDSHAAAVVVRSLSGKPEPARGAMLTAREREILQLVAQGLSNREIGARLYISETTVKFHVHNILEKLKVRRRAELVFQAGRLGLL